MLETNISSEIFREQLRAFLTEAHKAGYANAEGSKNWIKEKDGSTSIVFESGDFRMHDNFFGGDPYGGREVVFFKAKPFWTMVYYGSVVRGQNVDQIYAFLQEALKNVPSEMPLRGPLEFEEGNLTYENGWHGDITGFSGQESILNNKGQTVYNASYMGGWIDQQKG